MVPFLARSETCCRGSKVAHKDLLGGVPVAWRELGRFLSRNVRYEIQRFEFVRRRAETVADD